MKRVLRSICVLMISSVLVTLFSFSANGKAANVFYKSKSGDMRIALTFDDGPHPRITREIIDVLYEYDVTATFFVIGQNVLNYPEAMNRILESGCEVGNHTFSHKNMRTMSTEEILSEFRRCESLLQDKFSLAPTLIRPPEGALNDALYSVGEQMENDIILWSIDTRDWAHTSTEEIASSVLDNVSGGDIILMHDYVSGKHSNVEALKIIIPELLRRGYEFVTVSELINVTT